MSARTHSARVLSAAVCLALLLGNCSGDADGRPEGEPTPAETGGSSTTDQETAAETADDPGAAAEPGTYLPLQEGMEREWPEPVGSVEAENPDAGELAVLGVHRLDEEHAVVTGRLTLEEFPDRSSLWTEPGHFQGGVRGSEFSAVSLTAGDDTTYLPVRDDEGWCLCSTLNLQSEGETDTPVWTVVTAPPEGTSEVDVHVAGFGTLEDVPITDLPTDQSVPLGWAETLLVRSAERENGAVRVRLAIGNPTGPHTRNLDRYQFGRDWFTDGCFQGLAAWGSQAPTGHAAEEPDCQRGALPEEGEQVELEVLAGDPGTEEIVLLPTTGLPVSGIPVTGEAQEGEGPEVYPYRTRTESAGAEVSRGESLTVTLDTEVLFDPDESELTAEADATLDEAVETLEGQDGRTITVAGHTDTQGGDEYNLNLSRDRAETVAEALESRLGEGWTIETEWHGETQLAIPERGSEEEIEAARARNRRVEITVE
ncbi:hypothetical protein GCM10023169_08570 [Georgenia halophila]|uniref:OmpA-like domain-containing protein n=1 Tax=Georgenia halophila TaxID=620889 RepID=A0ABP8KYG5_9MICO